ncbi:hypothetical protein EV1_021105 [Malus domestica]
MASVVKGIATSSILNTYETERRSIAIFNTELSFQNFRAAMAVPAVLGLDPTTANSVHRIINEGVGSILPSGLQRVILDGIFTIGRAPLSESLLNENNPLGSSRHANLRRIFEEGKNLQFQFPAEDLGCQFRYLEGALIPDSNGGLGAPEGPTGRQRDYVEVFRDKQRQEISIFDIVVGDVVVLNMGDQIPADGLFLDGYSLQVDESSMTGESDHVEVDSTKNPFLFSGAKVVDGHAPCVDPGARLPHMNVRILSDTSSEVTISTPGLVSGDKVEFLLIIAPTEPSYHLAHAAFKVAEEFKVSARNYIDVAEVKKSSNSSSWWDICQMTDKGAILVRPDEHVAWRLKSGVVRDPITDMRRVFSATLGVKPHTKDQETDAINLKLK